MHAQPVTSLTLQFLNWISAGSRTYGEVMEAWRTSCPRMTVWEDAVSEGLVKLESNGAMKDGKVILTPRGRALVTPRTGAERVEGRRDPPV